VYLIFLADVGVAVCRGPPLHEHVSS
jgi:hypothetical protein